MLTIAQPSEETAMNKPDKSIGIRVTDECYQKIVSMCERLGGIPINNFAQNSIETCIEMLESKTLTTPKWIAVGRYSLDFTKGEKLK